MGGSGGLMECGEDRHRPENAAGHVAERDAELDRHVTALAIDAEGARQGLRDDVEGRLVAQRAGQPEAADRAIDQARIDRRQLVIAEPEPVHDTGPVILDEDVGGADEAAQNIGAGRLLQIDDGAFLVAVDAKEVTTLPPPQRLYTPPLAPP